MPASPTIRAYLDEDACSGAARIVAVKDAEIAVDRSWFYPGGGGQPADGGSLEVAGETVRVLAVRMDEGGRLWHLLDRDASPGWIGRTATQRVDAERRSAHARHHTLLHVLNTVAMRAHGGWITGCQIGTDYARIDFQLEDFSAARCAELEAQTNEVLGEDRPVRAVAVSEEEFRRRDDLRRTLDVAPPVIQGHVRIVEIEGFDAQACGGTHVRSTRAIGRCTVFRTENKGRRNKRLYLRLAAPAA